MAFLSTFMEFVLSLCEEDSEMLNAAKEINELSEENTKIENQLNGLDQEHNLLQIQLYNTEFLVSIINDLKEVINHFQQNFVNIYKDSVDLNRLLHDIDFTKILQCHYMEMEHKLQQQWQPLQEAFTRTSKLEDKMEQRIIVQEYRQKINELERVKIEYEKDKESMEKSLKQSSEQLEQATTIRNSLIVSIIKEAKELANVKDNLIKVQKYEEFIEGLKQKKILLSQNLEQQQLENFNPNHVSTITPKSLNNTSESIETTQILIPQLPSFADILKSFQQNDTKKTNITTIENTTEICIKSILHNSNSNQSITTKQTKNVRFKVQLEKYQEETTQTIYSEEIESETDIEIEMNPVAPAPQVTVMEISDASEKKENLIEFKEVEKETQEIETIDLLTQMENVNDQVQEAAEEVVEITEKAEIIKKSPIHIEECIVLQSAFPIQEHPQQESEVNITASCSKQTENSLNSSSSHANIKDILDKTKKSLHFEDFFNISTNSKHSSTNISATNTSAASQKGNIHKKQTILKDFEAFFKQSNEFLFSSKDSAGEEEDKPKDIASNFATIKIDNAAATAGGGDGEGDFLDFGLNRGGFNFDSDDNMTMLNKYKSGEMDFM